MAETYSSYPFISHDGPDENNFRAEVKVVTGFGKVASIEPSKGGKAAKVSFSVDNTEYLPSGWAPLESNIMTVVREAEETGEPIHFRLETRRQDKIDRKIPINELTTDLSKARDSIHKSLAAVKKTDDEWVISEHAKTNMAEDPKFGSPSAAHMSPEELKKLSGGEVSNSATSSYGNSFEPPPFITKGREGKINPGSAAVGAPLTIYFYVTNYFEEAGVSELVDERTKLVATKSILDVCNKAQLAIYDNELETPDFSLGSHSRARQLVFESVKHFYPLTPEVLSDKEALDKWKSDLLAKIVKMWKWSISEVSNLG